MLKFKLMKISWLVGAVSVLLVIGEVDAVPRALDGSGNAVPIDECRDLDPSADADSFDDVDGFPCSPFQSITPFREVFTSTASFNPPIKRREGQVCREDGHCADVYNFDITGVSLQLFGNVISGCRGRGTRLISFGGTVPAQTMLVTNGVEAYVQYNNKITRAATPRREMFDFEGCDRNGKTGVPVSVHNHGQASLAPFDGYAEDRMCLGETKSYMFPNNRPTTGWAHDHAVHLTALNVLHGLYGFYIITDKVNNGGCGDPYNLDDMEEIHLLLNDVVVDRQCQILLDKQDAHEDDYYGDINMVNGHPFPTLSNLQRKWYRFRILNASVSRPYLIRLVTPGGADVSSQICQMIAADGGYFELGPTPFPNTGLMVAVAERWEFVCDFSRLASLGVDTLVLYNDFDEERMKDVAYFTYSRLVAKFIFNRSTPPRNTPRFQPSQTGTVGTWVPGTVLREAIPLALERVRRDNPHREFKFGRSGGQWTINGETWDTVRIAASDVGLNTWELWKIDTGGGWVSSSSVVL